MTVLGIKRPAKLVNPQAAVFNQITRGLKDVLKEFSLLDGGTENNSIDPIGLQFKQ